MERREFLQKAAILGGAAALAPDLLASIRFEEEVHQSAPAIQHGLSGKMQLRFFPYELELTHTFTVATFSRKTTPTVQVLID